MFCRGLSMSHGERQAWAGGSAAVAAPPPKGSSSAVAALRSGLSAEATASMIPTSQWELLYRSVTAAQQADLLTLASHQGLLYSHQLPPLPSSRSVPPTDEPRSWNLLGKILA